MCGFQPCRPGTKGSRAFALLQSKDGLFHSLWRLDARRLGSHEMAGKLRPAPNRDADGALPRGLGPASAQALTQSNFLLYLHTLTRHSPCHSSAPRWVGPSRQRPSPAPAHRLATRVRTPLRDAAAEPSHDRNRPVALPCRFCASPTVATHRRPGATPREAITTAGETPALRLAPLRDVRRSISVSHANQLSPVRKGDRKRTRHIAVSPVLFTGLQVGRSAQLDERSVSHPTSHHRRRPRPRDFDAELTVPRLPAGAPVLALFPHRFTVPVSSSVCVMIESSEP